MSKRFEAVESWLDRVLDLPDEQARRLLDEQCDDADVRREVLELLGFSEAPGDAMELGVGRAATELIGELEPIREGVRIGPYELREALGEGGMGVVYRGVRADGEFAQEVAVKVLRSEMRGSVLAGRFAREREILAALDHPNIAKLFDGGTTADGQPYFVLELIRDAEPLIASCDRRELDLRQRMELMQQVCAAVDAAHRSLVVHRDLKSSNVLVNREGEVKLVDFGIAKLTGEDVQNTSTAPLMSPLTASPEQVLGEPITVASDVYQLGLLLYELLCGRHAHRLALEQRSGQQPGVESATPTTNAVLLARSIAEDDVLPPSRATPAAGARTAARRHIASDRALAQALSGDLDAVVLKALHKDPTRRYASARELAEDLGRWLRREPVLAAPDSRGYRLRKWTQRNPVLAGVSIVASVALLALAALTTLFVVDQQRQAEALRIERDRAVEAQALMNELFAAASPIQNQRIDDPVTATEILDRGAERLRRRLGGERSDLLADVLRLLADSNQQLGRYEISQSLLQEAFDLSRELDDEIGQVRALLDAAHLRMVRYQEEMALEDAHRAAEIARGVDLTPRDRDRLAISLPWYDLMSCDQCEQDRLDEFLARFEAAIETATAFELPPSQVARAHRQANDLGGAIVIYERQLESREDLEPGELGGLLNNLAYALKVQGEFASAEDAYREALAVTNDLFGEQHPNALVVRHNLASTLIDAGRGDEAIAERNRILEISRRHYADSWRLGQAHAHLAYSHLLVGDPTQAESNARDSRDIYSRTLHPEHDWLLQPTVWLSMALEVQGRSEESVRWLEIVESGYRILGLENVQGGAGNLRNYTEVAGKVGAPRLQERLGALLQQLTGPEPGA